MENKAALYQKMLSYLTDLGADLGEHSTAHIARAQTVGFDEMDTTDLLHYQRVLEATIDNRNDLMDPEAMKEDLTTVVRERFARGSVIDKTAEAKEYRLRLASL